MTDIDAGGTFIGLDIGTSAVKAVLVDNDQHLLASASYGYAIDYPRHGWAEQDPSQWWKAIETVMDQLRLAAPAAVGRVVGIGLSGQMHGLVLQDAEGEIVRPAILWNDRRASAECGELQELLPDLGELTGIGAMPSFCAAKLRWLRRHEPDSLTRARYLLLPKDLVRWKMSGVRVTDMCDASGAQLLDQRRRDWADAILEACGIDRDMLPRLVEGSDFSAILDAEWASRWGLPEGVVIAGGGGDVAAGAVGLGAINEGDAFLTLGTSSQMFVTTDDYRPRPEDCVHAFSHALPGRWFQMAAMLNGAGALAWVADLLNLPIDEALRLAGEVDTAPEQLLFLPYLNGERTPHDNPHARGVLFGLTPASGQGEVVKAVLEGVGFSLREAREAIEAAGTPIAELAVIGGGTRSDLWLQLLASIIDRPLVRYRDSDTGPAFGAARLARLAVTGEFPEEICQTPPLDAIFKPDTVLAKRYTRAYERYRQLYKALAPVFEIGAENK